MSNQLTIPSISTTTIPLRVRIQEFIQSAHPETHPDAFKWDIKQWETLRREVVASSVHVDSTRKYLAYHAQLVFILTKLPQDINLAIPYTRAFSPKSPPLSLSNLSYERVNVLFNLAALYCQLSTSEDRASGDGIKRAVAYFQHAAGIISYIISSALPSLEASLQPGLALPPDLSVSFLKALQGLMLAQAQECVWQRAVLGGMKDALIAKLSSKTSSLYKDTLDMMEVDTATSALFPKDWMAHVQSKYHHFAAAALYRKSVDDLEANRYGEELARLGMAKSESKKALDAARKGGVAQTVQDDIQSLRKTLEVSFTRAERDNDLIYHQDVPVPSSVSPIPNTKEMVASIVPPGLTDPKSIIRDNETIFGDLSGWGVKVAVDIYMEKKNDWVKHEILDRAQKLDAASTMKLAQLSLPAALDALDRPMTLPSSLLDKAEEVRLEDGANRIPTLIADVQRLARRDAAALDEALDILDQEATEDEEMREAYKVDVWTRPTSHEANIEFTSRAHQYRDVLNHASESGRKVRDEWKEWAERIGVLCWNDGSICAEIERIVPSCTSITSGGGSHPSQKDVRALRALLESLDNIISSRTEILQRAQRYAEADNIAPRLMREAAAVARWVEVKPEIFDDTIEEKLADYTRFRDELEENEREQEESLRKIEEVNSLFLESRREDPSVIARERSLQSLDLAYHRYREIQKNLTDEIKFYNDMASVLARFKEDCKVWVLQRRKDVEWLLDSLNSRYISQPGSQDGENLAPSHSLGSPPADPEPEQQHVSTETPPPTLEDFSRGRPAVDEFALDLPPPDSNDWQAPDIPAHPVSPSKPRVKQTTKAKGARIVRQ